MHRLGRLSPTITMLSRSFTLSFSSSPHRLSILQSQYHYKGSLKIWRPKKIQQLLKENAKMIDTKMKEIDQKREVLKNKGLHSLKEIDGSQKELSSQVEQYLNKYDDFVQIFQKCLINNEWIYKMLGWYNVTFYYKQLIERLLDSQNEETICLLDALSWMKYTWTNPYGVIDQDLRENRRVQRFYRNLSSQLDISYLKKVESIIIAPLVITKRSYYEKYLAANLQKMIKSLEQTDRIGISNLIWLFHRSIHTMVDQQYLVSKFQKYLLSTSLQLQPQNIEQLLSIYMLKGRINKKLYQIYLKPYILKHKMKDLSSIIQTIKFVICSECQDNALLKNLYELLNIGYHKRCLQSSKDIYDLHIYTHYLRIKGYRIKLNQELEKDLINFCRDKSNSRESLNKIIYNIQTRKNENSNQKYISQCLNVERKLLTETETTKRSVFQQQFKNKINNIRLSQMKLYQKPMFCCFQLDFCLKKNDSDEMMDVEIEGMQYVFGGSGRLVRHKQIRDEILTYYGFKVNHVNYNSFIAQQRISQDIFLMNKRIKGHNRK